MVHSLLFFSEQLAASCTVLLAVSHPWPTTGPPGVPQRRKCLSLPLGCRGALSADQSASCLGFTEILGSSDLPTFRETVPRWSLLWFTGFAAGWNHWLPPSLGSLHGTSGILQARSQGGGFQVSSSVGPLSSVSKVHGVSSNRDLPPTSGCFQGQYSLCCLGSLLDNSDNNNSVPIK